MASSRVKSNKVSLLKVGKSLRVSGREYTISFCSEPLERISERLSVVGEINQMDGVIKLTDGLCRDQTLLTVLHEALHGVLYNAGIDEHDEAVIQVFSHGIHQLLSDNKWLVEAYGVKK